MSHTTIHKCDGCGKSPVEHWVIVSIGNSHYGPPECEIWPRRGRGWGRDENEFCSIACARKKLGEIAREPLNEEELRVLAEQRQPDLVAEAKALKSKIAELEANEKIQAEHAAAATSRIRELERQVTRGVDQFAPTFIIGQSVRVRDDATTLHRGPVKTSRYRGAIGHVIEIVDGHRLPIRVRLDGRSDSTAFDAAELEPWDGSTSQDEPPTDDAQKLLDGWSPVEAKNAIEELATQIRESTVLKQALKARLDELERGPDFGMESESLRAVLRAIEMSAP